MEPFEAETRARGFQIIAGVDEAGRGPLAGPVVAAAVILPRVRKLEGVADSKLLTSTQREAAYGLIRKKGVAVGVGIVEAEEIDRLNILQASRKAMQLAVCHLFLFPDFLLVDGIHQIDLNLPQQAIPQGDRRCLSVAAASIIAKVCRDRLMQIYHEEFPEYNFAQHKGYATPEHLRALRQYGRCPIHRRSFRWVNQPVLL